MSDFSHLKKFELNTEPVEFRLEDIEGGPILMLAPATDANRPFFKALLKKNKSNIRRVQTRGVKIEVIEDNREVDRELYARHVVKGWVGVKFSDGEEAPFNVENALGFIAALPSYIFDEIRAFAGNPHNFSMGDEGDTLGNS